ncbi:O-antigen ligase family protein [Pseudomonas sp. A4002]|uniref:O-antigen ligase family protein n=1 Tax=unclassified Pseudomonas TaxID=196821 RepID=UPI0015A16122|nr:MULTISPECIES: O-antigen ligase family protein [unclassified Pseudomonas]NVZ34985.1 O-antigen ligase family protein [Pseudomonas sp. A4002]NWB81913.1 O-antigen ligase family protein [Pseudomonas sp. F9001]
MLLFLSAVLLCIPLRIFVPALGVEIAPSDLLCLLILPYILIIHHKINKWLLLSIIFSFISLIYIQLFIQPGNIARSILSIAFFFKPYLVYLLGRNIGESSIHPDRFNKTLIYLLTATALAATVDAIFMKGHVTIFTEFERIPGEVIYGAVFDPTFFGMKFHGSNGINGIAVFFSTAFMICLALGVIMKPKKSIRIISYTGMLCSLILVLGSGSRQAAFGLIVSCLCCFFAGKMTVGRIFRAALYITLAIVTSATIIAIFSDYFIELFAKILLMTDNIYSGNWDGVSSGRLGLYMIIIDDLISSPIFGTGFGGYGLFNSELGYFDNDVSTSGYTPHNQYLGAIWKMGGLAGLFYLIFLWSIVKPFFKIPQSDEFQKRFYIAMMAMVIPFFTVFNVFQDGLSSPSTGPIFLLIMGFYWRRAFNLSSKNNSTMPAQPHAALHPLN